MNQTEPLRTEAAITRIHEYRLGHGSLSQLIEDLRVFARTFTSRDLHVTEEFQAAWRTLTTIDQNSEPADISGDSWRQAIVYDTLDTIVRVIRRL